MIVSHVAKLLPKRFCAVSGPKHRVGPVFIGYLRNGLGATTICSCKKQSDYLINACRSLVSLSIATLKSLVVIFWLAFSSVEPKTLRTTLATV